MRPEEQKMKHVNYSRFREVSVMDFCGEEKEHFYCINENRVRKNGMRE
jgi:hypothetical protein